MIAIDTNVAVRILIKDDPAQLARSQQVFETNEVFISDTVILEAYWILHHRYGLTNAETYAGLKALISLPTVHLRDAGAIAQVFEWSESGLEFPDAMHLAMAESVPLVTFDRRFARRAATVSGRSIILLDS